MKAVPLNFKERVKPSEVKKPEKKSCKNCMKGKRIGITNDILCRVKGIVSEDYCCSSHHYFIMDDFIKLDFYRCSDCEFFIFHPHEHISAYGVCGMFSVRKSDGSVRKACSKFVRRKEHTA